MCALRRLPLAGFGRPVMVALLLLVCPIRPAMGEVPDRGDAAGTAAGAGEPGAAAVVLAPGLADQRLSDPDLIDLDLEDLLQVEIIRGASLYDQKLTEAPAAVTVIDAAEIRAHGFRTLAEVLEQVRGFHLTYDRNYHYLGMRGFGPAGDYNSRVLVLVDGHRVNENIYGAANIDGSFVLDVSLIDRLEVIRGPSSSIYGAHAFFGVVNVITRRPEVGITASAAVAGRGTSQGSVAVGRTGAHGLELGLSFSASDSRGGTLTFPQQDEPAWAGGRASGCDDERYYNLFAHLARGPFSVRGAGVWREKGVPTGAFGTVFDDDRTRTVDLQGFLDLRWNHALGSNLTGLAALSYDHYAYEGDYLYPVETAGEEAAAGDSPAEVLNEDSSRGDWVSAEYTAAWQLHARHKLIAGVRQVDNLRQEQRNYDEEAVYLDVDHDSYHSAFYLQDESRLLPGLILNGGVRYDHYSEWGGVTRPRVALILDSRRGGFLKLIYGEAFRPPNEYELHYEDDGQTQLLAEDLEPETIRTLEGVFEQYWGEHLRACASVYTYRIERLITLETDPATELLIYRNAGRIRATGAETEVEIRFGRGWHGRTSYAYAHPENWRTGGRLVNSPRHLLKFSLTAPLVRDRLVLGVDLQHASERLTKSGGSAAAYWLGNVTLTADPWPGGSIALSIYNVLAADYVHVASEEHLQETIPQDGRTLRLGIRQRF